MPGVKDDLLTIYVNGYPKVRLEGPENTTERTLDHIEEVLDSCKIGEVKSIKVMIYVPKEENK